MTADAALLAAVNRICLHQVNHFVHALKCGRDSRHQNLFPIVLDRRIFLRCADCNYRQDYIPPAFACEAPDNHQ